MKITKSQLKQIIKEEKIKLLNEQWTPADAAAAAAAAGGGMGGMGGMGGF